MRDIKFNGLNYQTKFTLLYFDGISPEVKTQTGLEQLTKKNDLAHISVDPGTPHTTKPFSSQSLCLYRNNHTTDNSFIPKT